MAQVVAASKIEMMLAKGGGLLNVLLEPKPSCKFISSTDSQYSIRSLLPADSFETQVPCKRVLTEPSKALSVTHTTDLNYMLIVKELHLMHSSPAYTSHFRPDVPKTELNATRQAQQMSRVLAL